MIFHIALADYAGRERRFGLTSGQMNGLEKTG